MSDQPSCCVHLAPSGDPAISPKVRQQFNAMVRRVVNKRVAHAAWREAAPRLMARKHAELEPLWERWKALSRAFALALHARRESLRGRQLPEGAEQTMAEIAVPILIEGRDKQMSRLRHRYNTDAVFGDDFVPARRALRELRQGPMPWEDQPPPKLRPIRIRSGYDRRGAEMERRRREVMQVLHAQLLPFLLPDMEHSAEERAMRVSLLESIEHAPARGNLLGLLEAQFALGLCDPAALEASGVERIKVYTGILEDQAASLQGTIREIQVCLAYELGCDTDEDMPPDMLGQALEKRIADLYTLVEAAGKCAPATASMAELEEFIELYGKAATPWTEISWRAG